MDDDEFDELIDEKINELIDLVEEHYGEKSVVERMSVLVDVVIAKHGVTWFGAFTALSRVLRHYGYQASVQCGEIEDEETADLFHQDGQVVLGYNSSEPQNEGD